MEKYVNRVASGETYSLNGQYAFYLKINGAVVKIPLLFRNPEVAAQAMNRMVGLLKISLNQSVESEESPSKKTKRKAHNDTSTL